MSTMSPTVCWGLNSLGSEEEHLHVKRKKKLVMPREKQMKEKKEESSVQSNTDQQNT